MKGMSWKRLSPYLSIGSVAFVTLLLSQCKVDRLIGPPSGGVLTLTPLALADSAPLGSTAGRAQRLIVGNGATGRITWTASVAHNAAWLRLAAATGTAPDTLPVTLVPSGLALGAYRDTIVVTGSGSSAGELRVPVELEVQPCPVVPIAVGTQISGTLGAASCGAPHRSGHPADLYAFSGSLGDSVSLELTAPAGYLVLDTAAASSKPSFSESGTCAGVAGDPCLFYQTLPRTGSYVVEVTTNAATDSGAYTLTFSPPRVPAAPATLTQLQGDSATAVNTGDTVSQNALVFRGVVSDPDRPDSLALEVEVKPTSLAFTGTGTTIGAPVKNGQAALVRISGLADNSSYHWRARAVDQTGRQGPWLSYGGNSETAADFVIGNSLASPTALGQLKSDGVTPLAVGATNATRTMIFRGTVTDPSQGEPVRLEVEYQPVGTPFTGVANVSSTLASPGATVQVTSTALSDNVSYHWQGREVSQTGRTSAWVSFGANPESAADLKEALTPQQLVFITSPTVDTAGAPMHPTVQVAARDSLGNTLASFHDTITVALDSNPGGATLSGAAKVAAVSGIATFPGLSLDKSGVGYRLRASISAPALAVQSGLFNVTSGAISPTLSTVTASPGTIHASAGDSVSTITVTVKDPLGNPVAGVTVTLADTSTGDSLRQPAAVTSASGVATGGVSARRAGVKTVTATAGGQALTPVATVTVLPAHAQTLTFTVQPTGTSAGATITPPVQITAKDSLGNVDTSYAGNVTVAIGTNPGGATLSGTKTVGALHGVASFGDLRLDKTGTGYTLTASAVSVTGGAASSPFNITAGTGTRLAFTVEPTSVVAGAAVAPAVEVTAQDSSGNTVSSFTGTVTVSLAANPGSDTLGGTTAVTAVGGRATFSGLTLHRMGAGYTLRAAATGFTSATSTAFDVRPGAATQLVFTTQPTGTSAGAVLPASAVTAQDAFGNTDTTYTGGVKAAIDSNPGGGVLGGTDSLAAVQGVVTYSTLTIDKAGAGYRLAATAPGLTRARSNPFNITAGAVSATLSTVTALPGSITAGGSGSTLSITARDSHGNPIPGATVVLSSTGTGNTITQPGAATDANGLATGSITSTKAESKTVSATVGGVLVNQTATITVNPGAISATASTLAASPAGIAAGGGSSVVTATALDAFGNPIPGLTAVLAATGSGNTITQPPSPTDASGNAVGALSSTASGAKVVSATIAGVAITRTDTVTVTSGGPTHLVFSVEPSSTTAGAGISPAVQVSALDANNNVATSFTGTVTVTIGTNPGGGTLGGTTGVAAVQGVATFPGLHIDRAAAGYTLGAAAGGLVPASSAAFDILTGPAAKLGVMSEPSTSVVNDVTFPQQPVIQIQDSVGNPVSQSGTTITATVGSGAGTLGGTLTALTGSGGFASFTNLKITGLVGTRTLTFTAPGLTSVGSVPVVVSAGAATQIAVNGGNHQAATAGTDPAVLPSVIARDVSGNPVAGVGVTFSLPGAAGANGTIPTGANQNTDASGVATVGSWTLGTTAKPDSMNATSTGLTGSPVTFVDTAKVGAPANIAKFSGDNLTGQVGKTLATPHDVLVTDANGNPVPNVTITWAAQSGGSVSPTTDQTDAGGHAQATRTLGTTPGTETTTATATIGGTPTAVTFTVTAQTGGASQMKLSGGDRQTDTVGVTLPVPLSVLIQDSLNNPVAGVTVSWSVLNGGGSVSAPTSVTNASGIASINWTLGTAMSPVDSTQLVQATAVASPITFTAFTVPGAVDATQTSVTATSPITASSGTSQSTVTVTARDQYGNVIKGKTVTLAATGTGNAVTNPASPTNANGVTTGTLSSTVAETKTVTATVGGVVIAQQAAVVVAPAAAASLNFVQQPTSAAAGAAIAPAITVEIRDGLNNRVTTATNAVSLALVSNPGGSTLSGTVTNVAAVNGVATFSNASLDKVGTGYTISASATGLAGATSSGFNVTPGAVSAATSTVAATSPITAGGTGSTITVTARDANGNLLPGATVVIATTGSGNTVTQPGGVTNASGVATGTVASTVAETKTVSATINGVPVTQTAPVTVNSATAAKLVFTVQPVSDTSAGPLGAVQVVAQDPFGNVATGFTGTDTIAIGTNPGGGTLSGIVAVGAASGVANFPGLSINKTGTGYTLTVKSGPLTAATSAAFNVTAGNAATLAFSTQPTSTVAGGGITPTVTVTASDARGNVATGFAGSVTIAIGTNPGGGVLGGTLSRNAAAGVAGFPSINIDKAGAGYTLTASATGVTGATSAAFNITPGTATKLAFGQQPTNAVSNATIAPAVTVTALDANGNVATGYAGSIALTIASNPGGGTLAGGAGVTPVSGVATFSGLSIDKVGTGYTLQAASGALTTATSNGFSVTPGSATKLIFTVQPGNMTAGASITTQVTAQDAAGNTATSFNGPIAVAIGTNPGGATLSGTTPVTATAGMANFTDLSLNKVGAGYTLTATSGVLTAGTSTAFNVTPAAATQLVFTTQPVSDTAGGSLGAVQVTARDQFGNTATGFTGADTVTIATNPGGGALSGTAVVTAAAGVASFPGLSINKAGTGYALGVKSGTLAAATSAAFNVTAGNATHLAFTGQPSNVVAGAAIAPAVVVTALDANNNIATTAGADTIRIGTNPGTAVLSGDTIVARSTGASTHGALSLNKAGAGYTLTARSGALIGAASGTFNVTAGTVSAAQTTVSATSPITAGGAASTVTVTARDGQGNPVAGATVVLAATGAGNTLTQPVGVTDAGGVATGTLTSTVAETKSVSATVNGVAITQTAPVVVNPGAVSAAQSTVTASSPVTASSGTSQSAITVTAKDAAGNPIAGATVVLAATGTGNTLTQPVGTTNASGVATGTLSSTFAESKTVSATINAVAITQTATVAVNPGTPANLNYVVQPSNATATVAIAPPIQVEVRDAFNNRVTTATNQVSLTILNNAGPGGTLSGSVTNVSPTSGVATFSNASIDKAGTGYTLQATATGLTAATSAAFNITAGAVSAAQSTVAATSPVTASTGTSQSTITVTAKDASGNPVAGATVVLAATGTGNTLTQPVGTTNASGVATGTLSSTAAESKTVSATISSVAVTQTATVVVNPATASQLVFTGQPVNDTSAGPLGAVQVTAKDQFGNVATGFAGTDTVTIANNAGPGGTLSGTTVVAAAAGVANFPALSIDKTGTGYTLGAKSGPTVTAATSTAFTVTPGNATHLAFTVQPSSATAGATIAPAVLVAVQDARNNTVTGFVGSDTIRFGSNPTGAALSGDSIEAFAAGVASHASLSVNKSGTGYTFTARSGPLAGAISNAFNITSGSVSASLTTVTATSPITAGGAGSTVTVTAKDGLGNPVAGATVVIAVSGTGNTFVQPAATNASGVATTTLTSTVAETKTVSATVNSVAITQTAPVVVNPGAPSAAQSTVAATSPVTASSGTSQSAITVTAKDANGNVIAGATVVLAATGTGNTLTQPAGTTNSLGVATGTLSSTVAESKTVSATIGGVAITQTAAVVVNPGAPANLNYVVQPSTAVSGASIAPPIQVEVRDALNNRVTTATNQVSLAILNNAGPGGTLSGAVTNVSPVSGVATFSNASIDKTGTGYTLSATATGLTTATSTAFNITAGTVSASQSTVGATSPITTDGGTSTITVTAKDAAGNPIAGATVVLAATGTGNTLTQPVGTTNASGVATGTLSSTVAESKTVSATVNGVAVTQTATVVVNVGTISAAQSTVAATSPITASSGTSQSTITVTAKDAAGNPIAGATVVLAATGTGNTLTQPAGTTNSLGVATGTLSSTVAQSKTVSATINGTGITQTATVVVNPGTPTNLNYVVQPSNAVSGVSIAPAIQVEVRDALNNRVTTATNQVSLAITANPGSGTLSGTVANVTPVSGVATFSNASIDKTGTGYTLSATATGLTTATSTAFNITAGAAATIAAASTPPASATVGSSVTAPSVLVTDAHGNPVSGTSVIFTVTAGNGSIVPASPASLTTDATGHATLTTWTLGTTAGTNTVQAASTGLTGTPVSFSVTGTAGGVSASQSTVAATSPVTASSGTSQSTITVTAKDAAGNPIAGATVVLAATGAGNTLTQPVGTTNALGVATGTFSSTVAESKTVSATINGTGITQTAPVVVNPAAASQLVFTGQPTSDTAAGSLGAVQVTARDQFGNVATGFAGTDTMSIGTNPGGGTLSGTVTVVAAAGVANFPGLSINKTGTGYTLSVKSGTLTPGTSASFNITAGTVSASQTTVAATSPITAGGAGSTITVTAKDGLGNPVAGATVVLAVSGTGNTFAQPALTNASGVTTTTLTSTVAETKTVSATVNSVAITQTASVVVNPGAVSAATSTVAATSPITASTGANASTITVTAKDANGNLIQGATVVLAATGSGNTLTQPVGTTNASGVATGTLSSTVAESKTVSATINGTGITQTATVVVNPGTPTNLNYVVGPSTAVSGASIAPAIQVEIRDALNNRVTTATNQISLAIANNAGGGTLSGTVTNVSPTLGVTTFSNASIDKAGTGYTLSATATGLTSATSPAFNITAGATSASQSTVTATSPITASSGANQSTITVTAKDANGNLIQGATVVLAATGSGNTLTQPAGTTNASGVATGTLSSTVAESKTVSATINGVVITQTAAVVVNAGAATQLVFTGQPSNAAALATINPAVVVAAEDAFGNVDQTFTGLVTLTLTGGVGPLTGTNPQTAALGVATFSDLRVGTAGTYQLQAAATGPSSATSTSFTIN